MNNCRRHGAHTPARPGGDGGPVGSLDAHRRRPLEGRACGGGRRGLIPVLAGSLLLWLPVASSAGERAYRCEVVEHLIQQGPNGAIARPANPYLIGVVFTVDRTAGRPAAGPAVGPGSTPAFGRVDGRVQVLASGNSESSFVATSVAPATGGGVHFSAIRVEEYAFEAKKPFVLMEGSMVISGTCE